MARNTSTPKTTRVRVQDTVGDSLTPITPVAPVHEVARSATAQAAQNLADFAGVGATFLGARQMADEKEGALQAKRDIADGIMDQEMFETNARYRLERETNRGRMYTATDLPPILEGIRNNLFGERSLNEVMAEFDDKVGALYSPNPENDDEDIFLNEAARHIERARAILMQEKQDLDLKTSRDAAETDFVGAHYEAAKEANFFDWQVVRAGAHALRDNKDADLLAFAAADRWARDGHPEVFGDGPEGLPAKFGTQASFKNARWAQGPIREAIAAGQKVLDDAHTEYVDQTKREQTTLRVLTQTQLHAQAKLGQLDIPAVLAAAQPDEFTHLSLITVPQAQALINMNMIARQSDMMLPSYKTDLIDGNGYRVPPEWMERTLAAVIADHPEEEQMAAAVDYQVRNNFLGVQQKRFLTMSPVGTPNFKPAFDLYQQFNRQKVGFMAAMLPPNIINNFKSMERSLQTGDDFETAEKFLDNEDSSFSASYSNGAINAAMNDVLAEVANGPWYKFWDDLKVDPSMRVQTAEMIRKYIDQNKTLEEAAVMALETMQENKVEVDGSYHSRAAGWHSAAQDSADWNKALVLPPGTDIDEWMYVTTGNSDRDVFLAKVEDQLPANLGRAKYNVSEMTALYTAELFRLTNIEQGERVAERRGELEALVFNRIFGRAIDYVSAAPWVTQEYRREQWMKIPERERESMLAQQLQEEEAKKAIQMQIDRAPSFGSNIRPLF